MTGVEEEDGFGGGWARGLKIRSRGPGGGGDGTPERFVII